MVSSGRTMPNARVEIERVSSPFNEVVARLVGERVDLDVEGATFATWHPTQLLSGYSWDALAAGCLLRAAGPPKSVLLLGLGGGTMLRQLRALLPDARFVAVEIDAEIVRLARRHMELDEIGVEVIVGDAYAYLDSCGERFDVVIDDLFLTGAMDVERSAVPEGHVLKRTRAVTARGGIVLANLITDAGHLHVRRAARAAFKKSFRQVRVVVPPRGLNEVLVGGTEVAPPSFARRRVDAFTDPEDQRLWGLLTFRTLQL
jgi:spermidine synthase